MKKLEPHYRMADPTPEELRLTVESALADAQEGCKVRLLDEPQLEPVVAHPYGTIEGYGGSVVRGRHRYNADTTEGVISWYTRGSVKVVMVACRRRPVSNHTAQRGWKFDPNRFNAWANTYPERYSAFIRAKQLRRETLLARFGEPFPDMRPDWMHRYSDILPVAHVPGFGMILTDGRKNPSSVFVVVKHPIPGYRAHVPVAPKWGRPDSRAWQKEANHRHRIIEALHQAGELDLLRPLTRESLSRWLSHKNPEVRMAAIRASATILKEGNDEASF